MISMIQTAQDPQAMMNQIAQTNPQMKQVMDVINQHGGDIGKAVRTVAEQNGLKPEDIMEFFQ